MLVVVPQYRAHPRRKDGALWCGHGERDLVVVDGVVVCGKCPAEVVLGVKDARRRS